MDRSKVHPCFPCGSGISGPPEPVHSARCRCGSVFVQCHLTAARRRQLICVSGRKAPQPLPGIIEAPNGIPVSNAAIIAGGTGGGIATMAGLSGDLIVDINGYFAPAASADCRFIQSRPVVFWTRDIELWASSAS